MVRTAGVLIICAIMTIAGTGLALAQTASGTSPVVDETRFERNTGIIWMKIGINAGYLSFNHRGGGDGNMPIFDRENFSAGSELELSL